MVLGLSLAASYHSKMSRMVVLNQAPAGPCPNSKKTRGLFSEREAKVQLMDYSSSLTVQSNKQKNIYTPHFVYTPSLQVDSHDSDIKFRQLTV